MRYFRLLIPTPSIDAAAACAALGVPRSNSSAEEQTIRALLHSERFVDQAPRTIYAPLLDEGAHHCAWRTLYRLREQDQATRRPDRLGVRHDERAL